MSNHQDEPILRIVAGSKFYGGIHAIDQVNFDLRPGEIHAVLGENGAGKSTLCKAISGAIELSSGDYILAGTKVSFSSPGEALKNGVAMVYQETSLVPSMTVAQNLELGMEKLFTVYRKINIAAQQSQQALNFNVDPLALVETLGTAKRQMVEIARAVRHKARVIIFDEPTASLTPEEMQHLFHLLGSLRSRGVGIIFISHALEEAQDPSLVIFDEPTRGVDVGTIPQIHASIRALAAEGKAVIVISSYLPEILAVSDRILVARGGRIVEEMPASEATEEKIMYAAIH